VTPSKSTMWRGVGISSRRGIVLEAYVDGTYTLAKFEAIPPEVQRSLRLVLVTARITRLTKRQLARHLRSLPQGDSPRRTTGPSRGRVGR
jgi:hypothetical protein